MQDVRQQKLLMLLFMMRMEGFTEKAVGNAMALHTCEVICPPFLVMNLLQSIYGIT